MHKNSPDQQNKFSPESSFEVKQTKEEVKLGVSWVMREEINDLKTEVLESQIQPQIARNLSELNKEVMGNRQKRVESLSQDELLSPLSENAKQVGIALGRLNNLPDLQKMAESFEKGTFAENFNRIAGEIKVKYRNDPSFEHIMKHDQSGSWLR